jgi:hypothetical protein
LEILRWLFNHLSEGVGLTALGFLGWLAKGVWSDRAAIKDRVDKLETTMAERKIIQDQLQEDAALMNSSREAFIRATEKLSILDEIKVDVKDLAKVTSENRERLGRLEGMLNGKRPSL